MGSKALIASLFAVSVIGVGIAAGTVTPILYGAGEANAQTVGAGLFGGLLSIGGALTALLQLFKNSTAIDFAKDAIGNLKSRDISGTVLDAAFVTIAATILSKKGNIDPAMLTDLGALRKKIEANLDTPK